MANDLAISGEAAVAAGESAIAVMGAVFGGLGMLARISQEGRTARAQEKKEIVREREMTARAQIMKELETARLKTQQDCFTKLIDASIHVFDAKLEAIKQQQKNIQEFFTQQTEAISEQEKAINARLENCDDFDEIAKLEPLAADLHDLRIKLSNQYFQLNSAISERIEMLKLDAADPARMVLMQNPQFSQMSLEQK